MQDEPQIPELGTVSGLGIDQYHALPAISNSGLSDALQSQYHYWARHICETRPRPEPTLAQDDGNIAHCAILEPDEFDNRYLVGPDVSRATKVWKAAEEDAALDGLTLIKPDQRERAMRQQTEVWKIREVAEALSNGEQEISAFWTDPVTGLRCRCRPDWRHPVAGGSILVDVKTFDDARAFAMARQIGRMGYYRQNAFYEDGYAIASGRPVLGFVFLAVEMKYPFAAAAFILSPEDIELGRREYREALDALAPCFESGSWPGHPQGIQMIQLPGYIRRQHDEEYT